MGDTWHLYVLNLSFSRKLTIFSSCFFRVCYLIVMMLYLCRHFHAWKILFLICVRAVVILHLYGFVLRQWYMTCVCAKLSFPESSQFFHFAFSSLSTSPYCNDAIFMPTFPCFNDVISHRLRAIVVLHLYGFVLQQWWGIHDLYMC